MNKILGALSIVAGFGVGNAEAGTRGTNLIGIDQNPETVYYLEKPSISELSAAILSGAICDFQAIRDTQGNIIGAVPNEIQEVADEAKKEIVWICTQR